MDAVQQFYSYFPSFTCALTHACMCMLYDVYILSSMQFYHLLGSCIHHHSQDTEQV